MKVVYGFDAISGVGGSVVSVGSFDGVHAGHRALIERMNRLRDESKSDDMKSIVVTFSPHPRQVIRGGDSDFALLNTIEEKAMLLERCGVDVMVVARFDSLFMNTAASRFFDILCSSLRMKYLVAGYNHRLGCDGVGGAESLASLGVMHDVKTEVLPEFFIGDCKVSSTVVRRAVACGDLATAAHLLTRPYFAIVGSRVEQGGLVMSTVSDKLLPASGIYKARVSDLCCRNVFEADVRVAADRTIRAVGPYMSTLAAYERLKIELL